MNRRDGTRDSQYLALRRGEKAKEISCDQLDPMASECEEVDENDAQRNQDEGKVDNIMYGLTS